MKPHTVILPFLLPRLSDTAAAQLVTVLQTLFTTIENHYAPQIHRHRRREQDRRYRYASPAHSDDPF